MLSKQPSSFLIFSTTSVGVSPAFISNPTAVSSDGAGLLSPSGLTTLFTSYSFCFNESNLPADRQVNKVFIKSSWSNKLQFVISFLHLAEVMAFTSFQPAHPPGPTPESSAPQTLAKTVLWRILKLIEGGS